jgi:hypothetical protein
MPVARYFLFVGGVLLALLFISDAYAPKAPVVNAMETGAAATVTGVDKSVIRIRSDRKWPERVVFDTNLPTIVPAQAAEITGSVPAATNVAEVSAKSRALDSYAQLKPAEPSKPELKPQRKRKIAKTRVAPPVMMVAQQPRFGFFNTW